MRGTRSRASSCRRIPIQPSPPPILPPNPIAPSGPPILPPNPIRLAWWTGSAWSPVSAPGSPPILPSYDSVLNSFTFDFTALSSPSVLQLGGTVFAVIPNYYFRGFGTPVDAADAQCRQGRPRDSAQVAGVRRERRARARPRSGIVKVSSVAIACGASGGSSDPLEEYAPGASGLEHLGDGVYQLNWKASKITRAVAGGCGSTSASAIRTERVLSDGGLPIHALSR